MASLYPELTWTKSNTEDHVWVRDTDEIETAYAAHEVAYEGSTGMFFAMTGHMSLVFPTAASLKEPNEAVILAIRNAWIALRHASPSIASQTLKKSGGFYKTYRTIHDAEELGEWLDQTVVTVTGYASGADFANSRPPSPPMPTLYLVWPSKSSGEEHRCDVVFRSPHSIIDGIGTLLLFDKLVERINAALQDGDFQPPKLDGSEVSRLSPPYRVAAGVPSKPTEAHAQRLAELAKSNHTETDGGEAKSVTTMVLPFSKGSLLPGVPKRVASTLSEDETARLLRGCKTAGVTPTHAFHAAIPIVMRNLYKQGNEDVTVRYVGYILRNERGSCNPPFNSSEHPATLYHSVSNTGLTIDLPLPAAGQSISADAQKSEFEAALQAMKGFYHGVRDDKQHAMLAPTLWKSHTRTLPATFNRPLHVPPPDENPSVSISSMGQVDGTITPDRETVRVYDPWRGASCGTGAFPWYVSWEALPECGLQ